MDERQKIADYEKVFNQLSGKVVHQFSQDLQKHLGKKIRVSVSRNEPKWGIEFDIYDESGELLNRSLLLATVTLFMERGHVDRVYHHSAIYPRSHQRFEHVLKQKYLAIFQQALQRTVSFKDATIQLFAEPKIGDLQGEFDTIVKIIKHKGKGFTDRLGKILGRKLGIKSVDFNRQERIGDITLPMGVAIRVDFAGTLGGSRGKAFEVDIPDMWKDDRGWVVLQDSVLEDQRVHNELQELKALLNQIFEKRFQWQYGERGALHR